jgi:hypothetical protein
LLSAGFLQPAGHFIGSPQFVVSLLNGSLNNGIRHLIPRPCATAIADVYRDGDLAMNVAPVRGLMHGEALFIPDQPPSLAEWTYPQRPDI